MFDERAFIARVESANTEQLAHLLAQPCVHEEKVLREHFGDDRYQRLHGMALRRTSTRAIAKAKGKVVVIHGIMGSELTSVDRAGEHDQIWVKALRIMAGLLERLRLGEDGRAEHDSRYDTRASGILKRHYGELLLSLSESWTVRAFWFDWRKDLNLAAAELEAQLRGWFDSDAAVHIVAHSMGGLVARTFIKAYPKRWEAMWDRRSESQGSTGGRLIMLGTPNHGSFAIPQVITGVEGVVKKLDLLDLHHGLNELLQIFNSFVGSYQMLPSPLVRPEVEPLYRSETYGEFDVPQRHLDNARRHHDWLSDAVDPERMIYVAGANRPTFSGIKDFDRLDARDAYDVTLKGDGRVPHELGLLETKRGSAVPTYYVDEDHGNLTANAKILAALDELLERGTAPGLSSKPPAARDGQRADGRGAGAVRERLATAQAAEEQRLAGLVQRVRTRSAAASPPPYVTAEEREMEEVLTRGLLSSRPEEERRARIPEVSFGPARIEIGLICGGIDANDYRSGRADPVDVISVGHYRDVKPQAAELALDRAISSALPGQARTAAQLTEGDLLLTHYSERGIILGELGQPFFIPDPRTAGGRGKSGGKRIIAIAGMGLPGRFGVPELAVLVRELCWSLGRMGKRHLATVLIGSGNGNLSVRDAVGAWMRGIKNAVSGSTEAEAMRLRRVTFVEIDPLKVQQIQEAIREEKRRLAEKGRLLMDYRGISNRKLKELKRKGLERKRAEFEREWEGRELQASGAVLSPPTRITIELEQKTYRLGAITETASIPEREIPLDPGLIAQANDELAAEWKPEMQLERGRFLERLLIPEDLRAKLSTPAPLVLLLDAATARIHWEMVAQPDLTAVPRGSRDEPASAGDGGVERGVEFESSFLGTSRGLTRQLRTTFAPPPEPPPPPRRILRVLIVADPAEDNRLPGAEQEGVEIAELFESFNTVYDELSENRVEVVPLLGPREATRTTVLRHLMLRSYNVLHFAGHCVYDRNDPTASGWIFTKGERLTPNELNRIDRIPRFVFSNACESGVTPDRSEERSVELAPTFAEAFFKRGVSNFVCTGWPVDDLAARQFASSLYSGLLGLSREQERAYARSDPKLMYAAMREARLAIARTPNGGRTWGAYQHYGDPYFRFFDPERMLRAGSAERRRRAARAERAIVPKRRRRSDADGRGRRRARAAA